MDILVPDMYQKSVYTIDYQKLKKKGIKCLLFDLNNTLVSYETSEPTNKLRELIFDLEHDFKVIIVSNSNKDRLRAFKEKLNVDTSFSSKKPMKKKFKKIMNLYNFKDTEIAMIGDVLLTDIWGGNRMNFTTILVNNLTEYEPFPIRLLRKIENKIIKKFNKKGILFKGKYYD